MTTPFPWWAAGFLALGISLAFIAFRQREIDLSRFPTQVQSGSWAGVMFSLIALGAFAFEFTWWAIPVAPALALTIAGLAHLLPRPARIAVAMIGIVGWPLRLDGCVALHAAASGLVDWRGLRQSTAQPQR